MARKKALDISPASDRSPAKNKGETDQLRLILFIFALVATASVLVLVLLFKPPVPAAEGEKIEIFLGSSQIFSGDPAEVRAFSSCGPFDIFLDQEKIASGKASADALIRPAAGRHTIEAKNARCASLLSLMVLERECSAGDQINCTINGCPGTRFCVNGFYTLCTAQKKLCVPGEKIGCSTNGCAFGYETCNACGSGYGPCLPRDSSGGSPPPCIGASCQ